MLKKSFNWDFLRLWTFIINLVPAENFSLFVLRTGAESNSTIDPEPSTRSAATLMQGTLTNLRKELSQQGLVVSVTLMMQEKLGLHCFVFRKVQLLLLAECGSSWVPGSARRRGAAGRQAPRQKAAARNRFYRTPALPWPQSECTQPPFRTGHIFPPRESIFWQALFFSLPLSTISSPNVPSGTMFPPPDRRAYVGPARHSWETE